MGDAVWQFAGICSWIIAFVEKVMKEVMLRNNNASSKVESDLFGEDPEARKDHTGLWRECVV